MQMMQRNYTLFINPDAAIVCKLVTDMQFIMVLNSMNKFHKIR
jgi:hypothetical protein